MAKTRNGKDGPTVIKKYANRRLYDTGRSSYVTLDDLCEMVKEGHEFVVQDAKTGKDITRSVLTQIVAEQESQGENLLPTNFLRTLIGFYGDNFQNFIPGYLEQTPDLFVKNQERMREQINKSFEGMRNMEGMFPPIPTTLEELRRQNMEMFEKTMKMMSPFGVGYGQSSEDDKSKKGK
jgi:polyhydroxyalkanoate synthesis repressor PhaR